MGCDRHAAHDGDSDHLWRNFPRNHVPGVAAAALKSINVWYNNRHSTCRDTCRIGDSAFASSVQNKGTARKGGSSEKKYLPTKKRYLYLLGFMIPSHAHDVEFEGDSKRYTSFIQISSTLPQFSLPLGDDLSDKENQALEGGS